MNDFKYFNKLLYAFIFLIFAITFIIFGYELCPDSQGYMTMSISREPIYPLFLLVLRKIFGEKDIYLYAASLLANFFASFAVYFATIKIKKIFNLNNIITVIIACLMLTPYYATVILFKGVATSCEILTESLTIPLYMIYFITLFEYLADNNENHEAYYIRAVILSILLSLTRGQMMICFVINIIVGILKGLYEIKRWGTYKKVFKPVLIFIASFLITVLLSRSYFYVTRGRFIGNAYGPVTAASSVLLAADESHAELFNNNHENDIKELYKTIAAEITKSGYRENLWDVNILRRGRMALETHDPIKFYISGSIIKKYLEEHGVTDEIELAIMTDKYHSQFIRTLIPAVYKNWLKIYASYILVGFIRTAAAFRPVLSVYSLCAYITSVILLFICLKKRRNNAAIFTALSLLAITGFASGISVFIMPLSRYVIYNTPFFYASLILSVTSIFKKSEN